MTNRPTRRGLATGAAALPTAFLSAAPRRRLLPSVRWTGSPAPNNSAWPWSPAARRISRRTSPPASGPARRSRWPRASPVSGGPRSSTSNPHSAIPCSTCNPTRSILRSPSILRRNGRWPLVSPVPISSRRSAVSPRPASTRKPGTTSTNPKSASALTWAPCTKPVPAASPQRPSSRDTGVSTSVYSRCNPGVLTPRSLPPPSASAPSARTCPRPVPFAQHADGFVAELLRDSARAGHPLRRGGQCVDRLQSRHRHDP